MIYLWFKWLHIIAIISWMCGVLYLYRLLINHREQAQNRSVHDLLCGMERRLYRYITVPAMVVSYVAGVTMLALMPAFLAAGWLHLKLTLVLALTASTFYGGMLCRTAAENPTSLPSSKALRFLNEAPTIFMMGIVWLVVFKAL